MSATISMPCSSVLPGTLPYQHTTISNSAPLHSYLPHSIQQASNTLGSKPVLWSEDEDTVVLSTSSDSDSSSFKPSLQAILQDQVGEPYSLENFTDFLRGQFCYENLAFWLTSCQYKLAALSLSCSIQEASPQFNLHQDSLQYLNRAQIRLFSDLQSEMLAILETFILPDSPFEINLSDPIRSKLLKAVTDGDYHPQILQSAQDSVIELMKSSSYPMFLESISGRDMPPYCSSFSLSSSSSTFSHDDSDRDRGSWRAKAKEHFKLVSRALKKA